MWGAIAVIHVRTRAISIVTTCTIGNFNNAADFNDHAKTAAILHIDIIWFV